MHCCEFLSKHKHSLSVYMGLKTDFRAVEHVSICAMYKNPTYTVLQHQTYVYCILLSLSYLKSLTSNIN